MGRVMAGILNLVMGIVSDYCFTLRSRSLHFVYTKFSFTMLRATSAFRFTSAYAKSSEPTETGSLPHHTQ